MIKTPKQGGYMGKLNSAVAKHKFLVSIPLAIVVTLVAIVYQRSTGPTYPKKIQLEWQGSEYRFKLPRSQGGEVDARVAIPNISDSVSATLFYRRFPSKDDWTAVAMVNHGKEIVGDLPNQPPAGKLQYYISLVENNSVQTIGSKAEPVMIRYKGEVPTWVLAPHIFCMFFAMLLSMVAAVEAFYRTQLSVRMAQMTLGFLVAGGLVLGPIVQKYAFGVYWAGFPWGYDLTDNKLLIGVLGWTFGVVMIQGFKKYWAPGVAAAILLAMYSIPHSMMGSELNYESGEVGTAKQDIQIGKPSY